LDLKEKGREGGREGQIGSRQWLERPSVKEKKRQRENESTYDN